MWHLTIFLIFTVIHLLQPYFMYKYFLIALVIATLPACNGNDKPADSTTEDNGNPAPPLISYNVVKVYPHDTSSYTEGLIWQNNSLYESAGSYNESRLFKSNLETAKEDKSVKLADEYFGEGIAILNNKIYQLTY